MRIGYGYDIHRLEEGHKLILGGVEIPFSKGLVGHSDADVLLHAIIDALLGACALDDIGQHFPDDDTNFKDVDSRLLLRKAKELIEAEGYRVSNIDSTIVAERPKLATYIPDMRTYIAEDIEVARNQVSIKATTSEKIGLEGEELGISARAVVLLIEV